MKTRTLLLLSVATGLAILLAGGAWLFLLAQEQESVESTPLGAEVAVGDVEVTVHAAAQRGERFAVDVTVGGVDDLDGVESFRLVTGQQELRPITAPAVGRCVELTESAQDCALEFAVDAVEAPNLVLLLRRGEEVARWDQLR
jgi:predicted RecB family endonuclease